MSGETIDTDRRRFLVSAASLIGGVGAACAAFPFLASWMPSVRARALGAPIEVDITKIEPGQKITVSWRGQPVFVVRRTPQSLADLQALAPKLRDPLSKESLQPTYATNLDRSIKPEILVLIGICTHLGCVPLYKPTPGTVEAGWEGGFFCPCHGSKYDMSGRVYKGVPAPLNLAVPPYQYLKDTLLLIGDDSKVGVST
jgi:ubiquinol-cytochrome c reductase iron-sulfur subunit